MQLVILFRVFGPLVNAIELSVCSKIYQIHPVVLWRRTADEIFHCAIEDQPNLILPEVFDTSERIKG